MRRYWVYVPAQYSADKPANVLVFQDGQRATNPDGVAARAAGAREPGPQAGDPGHDRRSSSRPATWPPATPTIWACATPNNRAAEYDALRDAYARFLIEEMLPEVGKSYNLTTDPERRAIGGTSSGAICAFTVAWHRPDQFRGVISLIGSYTSIGYRAAQDGQPLQPGGDLYPTLIRKTPIKPLSVFLQDGSQDLDNVHGNWFLANQQMLAAFLYANRAADETQTPGARYDVKHEWGDGAHSDQHGGAILPDILRWLWGGK